MENRSFWIGSSVLLIFLILIFDGKFFSKFTKPIYIVSIISLLLVLVIGKKIGGARSWFALGSFTLQPSEFAKTATLLLLSSYLGQFSADLSKWKTKTKSHAYYWNSGFPDFIAARCRFYLGLCIAYSCFI